MKNELIHYQAKWISCPVIYVIWNCSELLLCEFHCFYLTTRCSLKKVWGHETQVPWLKAYDLSDVKSKKKQYNYYQKLFNDYSVAWLRLLRIINKISIIQYWAVISKSVFRYRKVPFYPANIDNVSFYGKFIDIDIDAQY